MKEKSNTVSEQFASSQASTLATKQNFVNKRIKAKEDIEGLD